MKTLLAFLLFPFVCLAQLQDPAWLANATAAAGVSVTVTSKFILDVSGTAPWDVEIDNPSGDIDTSGYDDAGTYTLCILTNSEVTGLTMNDEPDIETFICTNNQSLTGVYMANSGDRNFALSPAPDFRSNTNLGELQMSKFDFGGLPLVPLSCTYVSCDGINSSVMISMPFSNYVHCVDELIFNDCEINDIVGSIPASLDHINLQLRPNGTIPTADADAIIAALVAAGADGGDFRISAHLGVGQGLTDAAHLVTTHSWYVESLNYPP